jgi:DNA-binding NtrC family response regulator
MSQRPNRSPDRARTYKRVLTELGHVAPSDASVLLWGEPGVGKEYAAQRLHALSPRRERPFVVLRCAGLSAEALGSELYGPNPGRTAPRSPVGLEQARGGTLLFDGVDELSELAQTVLLLSLHALRPASAAPGQLPPPRLVTSTTEDLRDLVRRGRFRRDLYHRLAVVRIHLPPLRQRGDDLAPLIVELIAEHAAQGLPSFTLAPDAEEALRSYLWPGNVRELAAVLTQAAWRARGGVVPACNVYDLLEIDVQRGYIQVPRGSTLEAAERLILEETLAALAGNKKRTAEVLGITRRTLYLKLARYGTGR